ncbi:MAG: ATP-binding protein [bacterium]
MSLLEIKGQKRAISIIKRFIEQNGMNTSFLFFGNQGVGKHLTALNVAKALNCTGPKAEVWLSDDACESCKKIDNNTHPDVLQLNVPMPNDVSQMDTMVQTIDWLNAPLFEGRQKVLIIDDASELNIHAQNAILKTLEEPPQWATVILITSSYARLLPTVQSRTMKIGFNRLSVDVIKDILASKTALNKEQIESLAIASDGGIKSFTPDSINEGIEEIARALIEIEDPASIITFAERFKQPLYKENFERISYILQSLLVDSIILHYQPNLIRNKGLEKVLASISNRFKQDALINASILLEEARAAFELNVNPQMIMEHVLFQLTGEH